MKKTNISPEIEFVRLSQQSVVCSSIDLDADGIHIADYNYDDIEDADDNDW